VHLSHFTSLIHASAIDCGPSIEPERLARATSLPNRPKAGQALANNLVNVLDFASPRLDGHDANAPRRAPATHPTHAVAA
jgi:hypothetical protein